MKNMLKQTPHILLIAICTILSGSPGITLVNAHSSTACIVESSCCKSTYCILRKAISLVNTSRLDVTNFAKEKLVNVFFRRIRWSRQRVVWLTVHNLWQSERRSRGSALRGTHHRMGCRWVVEAGCSGWRVYIYRKINDKTRLKLLRETKQFWVEFSVKSQEQITTNEYDTSSNVTVP